MQETEPKRGSWLRLTQTLSVKLNVLLLGAMVVIFALLGYVNVRLHRQHLEQNTLASAERISDVIKQGTTDYMLRNDREGLYRSINTMASEPGIEKIRIFDQEGRITYTTSSSEQSKVVDKSAEACYACHAQSQPLARLKRPDRFRIYRNGGGHRVLGVITPIENQPACSNASCHAHPADQQILGVLDTNLSLAKADVQLAESSQRMIVYTACALLLIAVLTCVNVLGLRWGALLQNVSTLTKFTAMAAFVTLGFAIGKGNWSNFHAHGVPLSTGLGPAQLISAMGVGLIAVFWAYDGWVYITWVSGEVKDPRRNVPLAMVLGVLAVGAIYLAMNLTYMYVKFIAR